MKIASTMTVLLLGAVLSSGCSPVKPDDSKYSGWMKDYSQLSESQSPTGGTALRWKNPALKKGQYKAIMVDRVGYYPAVKPSAQVPSGTLAAIPTYLEEQVRKQVGMSLPLVSQPGPGVLRLRAAITSVETPIEGLQAYEVIPIALVFAGVSTVAGTRDHNSDVYLEAQLIDSQTNVVMGKTVRRGMGKALENSKDQLKLDDVKPVLDNWARDAGVFVGTQVK